MENIISIVEELQATTKKNEKESILIKNKDNEEFKQFLKYVLDKSLVYGLQERKIKKFMTEENAGATSLQNLFECFEYLLENNSGTDKDAKLVASFIKEQSGGDSELEDFYLKAITKKLRMGIDKTVEKALPGLIERFEVMRAKSYHDYKDKIAGEKLSISEKMNGIRCITIKNGNSIIHKTRQNKVIDGLSNITEDMIELPDGVYDGELVVKNFEEYELREILQETMKIVNSDDKLKDVDYWVFDYLPEDEFKAGKSKKKYFDRYDTNPLHNKGLTNIKLIPELYRGNDESVINEILDDIVDGKKREGLMAYFNKPYVNKKTNNILKVKKKYSSDLRVVGFREGNGKNKGKLGALVLDYKGYELGCSGMSDDERVEIWEDKDKYLGVIVEVEHEQQTANIDGGLSLEYPAFIRFRFDKNEEDYAHE